MENAVFVLKFKINEKEYYVRTDWKENENDLFHIKIYDGDRCWTGRYSNAFAETFSENVNETLAEYKENVKKGLTKSSDMYVYDFSALPNDPKATTFKWKKRIDRVLMVHGSVPLHLDESLENKNSLIDILLDENKVLKQVVEDYDMNIQMLNAELETTKTELEKFVNIKTSLEMSVYGKFVQLLNSKKRRIQLLEQNLQDLQHVNGSGIENDVD